MAYPSLEQYNLALQSPQFALQDPELKKGRLRTSGLGFPLALCGGFALTYTVDVGPKKFALRCFHKESRELEQRYLAISARLKQLASPYFLPFEFIPNGIRIDGALFPIVKMAWAQGRTLAEFLESEYRNTGALAKLRQALSKLADFLEAHHLAHGDIQPENVMVNSDGSAVQLIDYDGMFVDALRGRTATELGQINFQHPKRTASDFNERLDRFSFLTLDVALQALAASPTVWVGSRSEPSAVVFRRNDFLAPGSSTIFNEVIRITAVAPHVRNLARVAAGDFAAVPTLSDFLAQRGITGSSIVFDPAIKAVIAAYHGAYLVCDATNYSQVLTQVGNRIELVGQVHSIRNGWGANKRPYIFVNFSDWRGKAVKLSIWSDGMKAIEPHVPDATWKGRWISVTGLVDPPYAGVAKSVSYTHLSITITKPGQIQQLPETEARFRLRGQTGSSGRASSQNADVLREMVRSSPRPTSVQIPTPTLNPPKSANQQILERMRTQTPQAATPPNAVNAQRPPSPKNQVAHSPRSKVGTGTWLVVAVIVVMLLRACVR